jgi:cyanophycinase
LERGDKVLLDDFSITPSAFKAAGSVLDPFAANYKPEFGSQRSYPDALGKNVLIEVLTTLLDSKSTQTTGLALRESGSAGAERGYRFVWRKAAGTKAWLRIDKGRAHYTVANVAMDVEPVRVAQPLFTPR